MVAVVVWFVRAGRGMQSRATARFMCIGYLGCCGLRSCRVERRALRWLCAGYEMMASVLRWKTVAWDCMLAWAFGSGHDIGVLVELLRI